MEDADIEAILPMALKGTHPAKHAYVHLTI